MDLLKSTGVNVIMVIGAACAFVGTYFMNLTANNTEQYLAVVAVVLLDGFFGLWAGVIREGFKTYKAIKVLKTLFAWILILTVLLSVELGFISNESDRKYITSEEGQNEIATNIIKSIQ